MPYKDTETRRSAQRARYAKNIEHERTRNRLRAKVEIKRRKETQKNWRLANPEAYKAQLDRYKVAHPDAQKLANRKWTKAHPDRVRNKHLLRTYGITQEDYDRILLSQDGKCAICSVSEVELISRTGRGFHVDHNHKTGEIRGLLCGRCNRGLGCFTDNAHKLELATKYIKEHDGSTDGNDSTDKVLGV